MCVDIIVCAQTVGARAMSIHQSILVLAARNSGARRGRSSARATLVRLQLDPQPITTVKNRRVPAELAAVSSAAASKAAPTPDLRASRPSMRREAPVGPFLPRFAERVRTLSTGYLYGARRLANGGRIGPFSTSEDAETNPAVFSETIYTDLAAKERRRVIVAC